MSKKANKTAQTDRLQYLSIGKFGLHEITDHPNMIWINNFESGDGGAFSIKKLEEMLDTFYAKEF